MMTFDLLELTNIRFLKGAEIGLLSLSDADMNKIMRLLKKAAKDLLKGNRNLNGLYEIRYKDFMIIFKVYAQYIEVSSILNSHVFRSPDNAILYERA